jgi:hypothetical protein
MDPITLILNALSAGAVASVQSTASDAVKDLYNGLKTRIQHKLSGKQNAELVLSEYESDPETWETPLKKVLTQEQVYREQDILAAARSLILQINPRQDVSIKYSTTIYGNVEGYAQGDNQQITMNFGNKPDEQK